MTSKLKLGSGGLVLASLVAFAIAPASSQVPGAPAQVVAFEPPTSTASFKVTSFGRSASARDDKISKARFRVVKRTGNCCENYLTSSSRGRLFDIGGSYINFTDDNGASWESVRPPAPLVNGEGTMATGPGGDVLGVEWDPYSGDHLVSYKYDAEGEAWSYLEAPLHTPFYDRPWLSVVPGPFTVPTGEVPYVTFVDGYPHTGQLLYSTDGLAYLPASSPFIDDELEEPVESWIPVKKMAELDWIQPNTNSPIIPLGGGRALTPPDSFGNTWSILNPETLRWAPFTLPGGADLRGRMLVDGKGRIHNLVTSAEGFDYRISTNGGRSWTSTSIVLPPATTNVGGLLYDFRANSKVGIAAVTLHARRGDSDLDLLYKLDITTNKPRLTHLYEIGKGDIDASNSGPPAQIRFDFATVTILPNGKLAVSFLDSTTDGAMHLAEVAIDRLGPALAVEL
jgi:hypothetical protein